MTPYIFVGTLQIGYPLQVKTMCWACSHTLLRVSKLQASPPCRGEFRRCHVLYGSGPRLFPGEGSEWLRVPRLRIHLSTEEGSDTVTRSTVLYLASPLRRGPVLPHVL
jgi:hypothetical protein